MDPDLQVLARGVVLDHQAAPCAVVSAASLQQEKVGAGAFGFLAPGETTRAHATTRFDLASLTKPVTALVAARLVRTGRLAYDWPLGRLLPYLANGPSGAIPLELLLAHRAGLAGHVFLGKMTDFSLEERRSRLQLAAAQRRQDCVGMPPRSGFAPMYSDLGYLLVAEALAAAARTDFASLVAAEINAPLDLKFRRAEELTTEDRHDVAPTEWVADRGGLVRGIVHDENAWTFGGLDVCGHAGLFGTAADVLGLGVAVLEALGGQRPEWLQPKDLTVLTQCRPGGSLRAGFDGKSGPLSSAGTEFGPATFGHLGFTGTSLWMDPNQGLVGVLLSNRICPTRAMADRIQRARPIVYDGIAHWARASRGKATLKLNVINVN